MSNETLSSNEKRKFDLTDRTARFGETVIILAGGIKETTITRPLISQLVRSATSIGANYMEADCAESKRDFVHKISIAKKESKETMHWLHMISVAIPEYKERCLELRGEAKELMLIFAAITRGK